MMMGDMLPFQKTEEEAGLQKRSQLDQGWGMLFLTQTRCLYKRSRTEWPRDQSYIDKLVSRGTQ